MRKNLFKTWKRTVVSLAVAVTAMIGMAMTVQAGGVDFATAQPIPFGYREVIDFSASGAAHYYTFTTDSAPGWYSFNLGKSGGAAKYLYVYAQPDKSNPVLSNWYQSGDGNTTKLLPLIPNKQYWIMVEPRYNDVGGTANFTVTKIPDDYGNDLATGTPLALGQTVTGNIEVTDKGECDTFAFTTTGNNSYYEMALSCTGQNPVYAHVYMGPDTSYDNYEIYASSSNTSTLVKRLENNKTYYVKISGRWDDATSYKFVVREIRDDAGDDFSAAATIKNGTMEHKTIQVSDDVDFFKFKTSKKLKNYQFTFKNKSTNGMRVTIYNNGDIASAISSVNNYYVSGASQKVIWLNLAKNRTYYIKVTGGDNASYGVQMKDLKSVVKKTVPKGFKVTSYSYWSQYAKLTWTHQYDNATYEIWRSTSPKSGFKKIKTLKNTNYYYDYGVKRKKTYYYKIRYVVKENGKVCNAKWTKAKKVKIRY